MTLKRFDYNDALGRSKSVMAWVLKRSNHPISCAGPSEPIIEDWVSDSEDESETKTPQIVPSFVQSTEQVKSPRPSVQHVETSIPAATTKPASPKPTSNGTRRNKKACFVCKKCDESWPPSSLYDRFQFSDGYHVVPPPYSGTFMPPKPNLVFNNAPN
nr:hypothetical protein [Tanacetum cinerariifolium]GFA88556.1 hypothetical protein [Tanacetum cinerariifolium]